MLRSISQVSRVLICVFGILGFGFSSALSQQPNEASKIRGFLELINAPGVLADMEVVEFQREAIQKALAARKSVGSAISRQFDKATPEERKKLVAEYDEASANAEAEIVKCLLPKQLDRLKQIRMNIVAKADGATMGLKNREFLEYLDLSEAQKSQIEAKAAEVNKKLEDKLKKIREEIQKVQLEARDDLIQILTPEQREKYLSLVGRPFEREPRR